MNVYSFDNIGYLENDLKDILERIGNLYNITFDTASIKIETKISDTSNAFWASEQNSKEFNRVVPNFKSLHKDMYAIIEAVSVFKQGKYDYNFFEAKYSHYKEFRLLNNLFKHLGSKNVEIKLVKIALLETKQFDLICTFKYPDSLEAVHYSEFIVLFLTILKDFNVILF